MVNVFSVSCGTQRVKHSLIVLEVDYIIIAESSAKKCHVTIVFFYQKLNFSDDNYCLVSCLKSGLSKHSSFVSGVCEKLYLSLNSNHYHRFTRPLWTICRRIGFELYAFEILPTCLPLMHKLFTFSKAAIIHSCVVSAVRLVSSLYYVR